MKVQAVVFPAENQIEIRDVELAPVAKNQIRTETLYSFVSPGTELRTLAGHYGANKRYPIIPGYSVISRVAEVGSEVHGFKVGDLISNRICGGFVGVNSHWGGEAGGHVFDPYKETELIAPVILPAEARKNPLPYAVVEVASISYRGMTSADPQPGEHAVVIGQGSIGAFTAEFLRMKGCLVTVCDISESRLANARAKGFECVALSEDDSEARLRLFGYRGFDIVAECSGSVPGFKLAAQLIRRDPVDIMRRTRKDWPRLLLQANYVDEIPLNPGWFFPGEGMTLLAPSDRSKDDRLQVTDLIRRGIFDPSGYVENVFKPEEMPEAYRKLQNREITSAVCKWRDF